MLQSSIPLGVTVLRSHAAYKVKTMESPTSFDLYVHTCANGFLMLDGVDGQESDAPVGHIKRL